MSNNFYFFLQHYPKLVIDRVFDGFRKLENFRGIIIVIIYNEVGMSL